MILLLKGSKIKKSRPGGPRSENLSIFKYILKANHVAFEGFPNLEIQTRRPPVCKSSFLNEILKETDMVFVSDSQPDRGINTEIQHKGPQSTQKVDLHGVCEHIYVYIYIYVDIYIYIYIYNIHSLDFSVLIALNLLSNFPKILKKTPARSQHDT